MPQYSSQQFRDALKRSNEQRALEILEDAISKNYAEQLLNNFNLRVTMSHWQTPLQYAAATKACQVVQMLLAHNLGEGVDDYTEYYPHTPLFLAVRNNDTETVHILLKAGADPSIQCGSQTPRQLAKETGSTEIVKLFNNHAAFKNLYALASAGEIQKLIPALEEHGRNITGQQRREILYKAVDADCSKQDVEGLFQTFEHLFEEDRRTHDMLSKARDKLAIKHAPTSMLFFGSNPDNPPNQGVGPTPPEEMHDGPSSGL